MLHVIDSNANGKLRRNAVTPSISKLFECNIHPRLTDLNSELYSVNNSIWLNKRIVNAYSHSHYY